MSPAAMALAVLATAAIAALAVLTALGGRRRGDAWPLAVLGGVFFPVAWAAWYVHDGDARRDS